MLLNPSYTLKKYYMIWGGIWNIAVIINRKLIFYHYVPIFR